MVLNQGKMEIDIQNQDDLILTFYELINWGINPQNDCDSVFQHLLLVEQ